MFATEPAAVFVLVPSLLKVKLPPAACGNVAFMYEVRASIPNLNWCAPRTHEKLSAYELLTAGLCRSSWEPCPNPSSPATFTVGKKLGLKVFRPICESSVVLTPPSYCRYCRRV